MWLSPRGIQGLVKYRDTDMERVWVCGDLQFHRCLLQPSCSSPVTLPGAGSSLEIRAHGTRWAHQDQILLTGKKESKYTKQSLSPNCKDSPENVIPHISNSRTQIQISTNLILKYLSKFYCLLGHVSWFWAPSSGTAIGIVRVLWSQPDASLRLTGGNVAEKRSRKTWIEKKNDEPLNTFES